jgi:hypothetical protein
MQMLFDLNAATHRSIEELSGLLGHPASFGMRWSRKCPLLPLKLFPSTASKAFAPQAFAGNRERTVVQVGRVKVR